MKYIYHKPSGSIYPYNHKRPNYLRGMGDYDKRYLEIKTANCLIFWLKFYYQTFIKRKALKYKIISIMRSIYSK